MKILKLFFLLFIMTSLLSSCEKESKVVFRNRSAINRTYNVIWDGSVVASLYPQEDSDTMTVLPGPHTLVFEYANSGGQVACKPADPVIVEGRTEAFTCSY
ncbi:MAG: hypothetical protein AAGG75_23135 [Bacteroidota bacterium]